MNNTRLKKLLMIITAFVAFIGSKKVYCITDNFKFVIETIGVPRYNVYGKEINEEVYKAYNVFSYGWPEELSSNVGQRWKNSKYGLWSQGSGAYNGYGIRGEYNLLGRDYSGNVINNYYFPVDTIPETTPEYWSYYSNPGATDSWKDKNKYKYIEQLEFMKNTKLMFNDISSRDNSDNPDKIREYNITANMIGLDKARLDVCSTWKTNGIIHTRRKVNGQIRYAVFLTKPMAANANVQSGLNVNDSYVLGETEDSIEIEISYDAIVVNMTGYAKENHIKEIESRLYINGKEVESISGSKTANVGTKYILKLSRASLVENKNNQIVVRNDSYAHTEFAVDGLMQDSDEKIINIFVKKEKVIPLKFNEVKVLEKDDDSLVVRPLAQAEVSKEQESTGITEAGKYLVLKLKIHDKVSKDDLEDIELKLNDDEIKDFEIIDNKSKEYLIIKFKLPLFLESTIYGWKSLREVYGNYFNINEKDVGKRIVSPHNLKIISKYKEVENEENIKIDTIDDYITNMNYTFVGSDYEDKVVNLEEWID